ncbi:MAG TPA: UvrD-helicase domain-containing protein [Desulfuromonadales bacterium]|nr:UvrD-helicase domain-containing protein [Desulfuromonadales bacterium]
MTDDLTLFNDPQREAILHTDGPMLILAGAGSGKTRVITHRIARLVKDGVPVYKILSMTFTNKAAREMSERVTRLIKGERPVVSTFHSFCSRILRQDIHLLDPSYNSKFTILDMDDVRKAITESTAACNLDSTRFKPAFVGHFIDECKNRGELPGKVTVNAPCDHDKYLRIYTHYQEHLRNMNTVDFGDLLTLTLQLFQKNEEVLRRWQEHFDYIQIDEYQDTNHVQYQIARLLAARTGNLCVIGDADQSVYSWRGADIRNILDFEKDFPDAKIIKLEQNYRCGQRILQAANAVIANNQRRKSKTLFTENSHDHKIVVAELEDQREEGKYVAEQIHKGIKSGFSYSDQAVLYRMNAQSRSIEEALMRAGIPYAIVGGLRFYDRLEIKDVLAYLRLLSNTSDDMALRRIINVPARGIGKQTIDKLAEKAASQGTSLFAAVLNHEEKKSPKVAVFAHIMTKLQGMVTTVPLAQLVESVIIESGYESVLMEEGTEKALTQLENIKELISVATDFDENAQEHTLEAFLEKAALVSSMDDEQRGDRVTLLTMHSAKGLEFGVCFIVGAEEGIFPHSRSLGSRSEMEEERRLCYVSITRAKERLYITHARSRIQYGSWTRNPSSRFLEEIPSECIEQWRDEAWSVGFGHSDPASRSKIYYSETIPDTKSHNLAGLSELASNEIEVIPEPQESHGSLRLGMKLRHAKFGVGTLNKIEGEGDDQKVIITFNSVGLKKLLVRFAGLEIA